MCCVYMQKTTAQVITCHLAGQTLHPEVAHSILKRDLCCSNCLCLYVCISFFPVFYIPEPQISSYLIDPLSLSFLWPLHFLHHRFFFSLLGYFFFLLLLTTSWDFGLFIIISKQLGRIQHGEFLSGNSTQTQKMRKIPCV